MIKGILLLILVYGVVSIIFKIRKRIQIEREFWALWKKVLEAQKNKYK